CLVTMAPLSVAHKKSLPISALGALVAWDHESRNDGSQVSAVRRGQVTTPTRTRCVSGRQPGGHRAAYILGRGHANRLQAGGPCAFDVGGGVVEEEDAPMRHAECRGHGIEGFARGL